MTHAALSLVWKLAAATSAATLVGGLGCARAGSDRPDLGLPPRGGDGGMETREGTGVDVRTIDETGNAPDGPVSPGGSTPGSRGGFDGDFDGAGFDRGGFEGPRSSAPTASPLLAFAEAGGAAGLDPRQFAEDEPEDEPEGADASGGYRTVGGVLAEVNGRAIYTDEVIAARRPELRGLAVRLGRERFLQEAGRVLGEEVAGRVRDELRLLVAERNLRASDRQRAVFLTTQWRVKQITDAGGSEAVARQRALADSGLSLEKLGEVTYGRFAGQLFAQLVLEPRAAPSANEVRDYFRRHREEFASKGSLQFLLIEVDASKEPEKAALKADRVRELAAGGGEDFAALARGYNDNPYYKRSGGRLANPDPLPKGGVAWPELEAALWATPEGGVTPVVPVRGGGKLLVAKLVEKREPREADFAEAQGAISGLIRARRMEALQLEYLSAAKDYATVTPPQRMARAMQTALEVVAQEYDDLRRE